MKDLVKFEFKSREIRTVTDEHGEAWFVAKDVCDILGIGTEQIRRIPDTQKGLRQMQTPGGPLQGGSETLPPCKRRAECPLVC